MAEDGIQPSPDPALERDKARGRALGEKLAGYPGPAWRKAYLEGLLRSGMDFLETGNRRTAAYCLDKVEAGIAALPAAAAARSAPAAEAPAQALERVRARWRQQRVKQVESVLAKHGPRLSNLERKAFEEGLAKVSRPGHSRPLASAQPGVPGLPAAAPGAAEAFVSEARLDQSLQDLRRRLYARILKSQKSILARRRGGGPTLVRVHEQFPGPVGPYNDRQNLEGVITLLAEADPAWVEEFLELYKGLSELRGLLPS